MSIRRLVDEYSIAALFAIAPNNEQLKCPLTGEQISKRWDTDIMKYYPATKRNALLITGESQNSLRERSQTKKKDIV